jgi:predicted enzyme related to lactoylglutathione lyase
MGEHTFYQQKETRMKIALTNVYVHSPELAFAFYTEVLGFVPRLYVPEASLAIVASPEEPDGTGLLLEPNGHPLAKAYQQGLYEAGMPVIVFGVADLRKEYERLTAAGVIFRDVPTQTEAGMLAIFEDTCGNLIQLHQAP